MLLLEVGFISGEVKGQPWKAESIWVHLVGGRESMVVLVITIWPQLTPRRFVYTFIRLSITREVYTDRRTPCITRIVD